MVDDSPLVALADSPDTYAESPQDMAFLRAVPASWDETRFLAGKIGEYTVLAKRKADTWYLGVLNNGTARNVQVPLDKLGTGCVGRL